MHRGSQAESLTRARVETSSSAMMCLTCRRQFGADVEWCPYCDIKLVESSSDPFVGMRVADRYHLETPVGYGGWSMVYKATDEKLGRTVAVKILHLPLASSPEKVERFRHEAHAASSFNHPNIATIYDYGALSSGQPYLVMEFLNGKSLSEVLKERGKLTQEEAVTIFVQACDALSCAHDHGIIHRDIKPNNVVIVENSICKLVDFGLAKFVEEREDLTDLTRTGETVGTPPYMSPEQCTGKKLDHRSDIYSLACAMYESLTGVKAFSGMPLDCMNKQVVEPPAPFRVVSPEATVAPELELAVMKALEKDPAARFQNARQFKEAIARGGAAGKASLQTGVQLFVRSTRHAARGKTGAITLAIGSVLFIAALYPFVPKGPVPMVHKIKGPDLPQGAAPMPMKEYSVLFMISNDMASRGEINGAIQALEQAKNMMQSDASSNPKDMADCLFRLAELYEQQGEKKLAAEYFANSIWIEEKRDPGSDGLLIALDKLTGIYLSSKSPEAKATYEKLCSLAEKKYGKNSRASESLLSKYRGKI